MYNKPIVGEAAIQWLERIADIPHNVALTAYNSAVRIGKMQQLTPPMKGVFVKLDWQSVEKSLQDLDTRILKVISQRAARNPNFKWLYDFEKFQSGQKGPVQQVTGERVVESVTTIVENSSEDITTPEGIGLLEEAAQLLRAQLTNEGLSGIIKPSDVAPTNAWASMNHSSKRGLPWLEKGNFVRDIDGSRVTVDDAIMKYYGNNMHTIVDNVEAMKVVVGVIGLRLQGVAVPNPAKVRIIFMPEIPEQYALRAIQDPIQQTLKSRNAQMGYAWADPIQYRINMSKAMASQNKEYYYVSLDYSKYDTRSSFKIRNLALRVLLEVMLSDSIEWKTKLIDATCRLWVDQYMLAPNSQGTASIYHVPNLLTSGDVFTQLLGNTMNRLYQYAISMALHYRLDPKLGLELGDDTVLPIPKSIVDKIGSLDKLYETLEEIIESWGSKMNVKKQFPNIESAIFLQRLYKYDSNIEGEYSLIRATQSLVWAERPRKPIDGVKNLDALETIGQLGLLNLISIGWGKVTNRDLLESMIMPWWLDKDKALLALAQDAVRIAKGDFQFAGALVFSYLVKAVGGATAVADGLDIKSYDQYELGRILSARKSLNVSLPVLSTLCIAASKLPVISFAYNEVYKVETVVTPQVLSDFLSEGNGV